MRDTVGREPETEALVGWFDRSGPAMLVLEGEAGIGKTTVWEAALESIRASGAHVLVSSPAEAESRLSYSGLADLLASDVPAALSDLPAPQATALAVALRLALPEDGPGDETAVARGLLSVFRNLAKTHGRLLIAIDDLRWIDPPSLSALAYSARRLVDADHVRLLVTQRLGAPEPPFLSEGTDVERIRLGPVSLGAIHRMIRLHVGITLPRPQLIELYNAAAGNPLHALELGRAANAHARSDLGTLDSLFLDRLGALPATSKRAFLLIATSSDRSTSRLERAWNGDLGTAIAPALEAGLLMQRGHHVLPAHPLYSQLAYEHADDVARRDVHTALAATAVTAEERAMHLGRATIGPDETAASVVEAAAVEAAARGIRATSAKLFESAARLTPDRGSADRARRTLAAASAWFEAGDLALARASLEALTGELPAGGGRAQARLRLGIVQHEGGLWQDAMTSFAGALDEAREPRLIAEVRRRMAVTAGYIDSVATGMAHAAAALEAAEASGDPETLTYCLATLALAHVMAGAHGQVVEAPLERALILEREIAHGLTGWTPRLVVAELARLSLDLARARDLYAVVLAEAETSGDATLEHWAAYGLGSTELLAGDYLKARLLAERVIELAETTGVLDLYGRRLKVQVEAHLGLAPQARELGLAVLAGARASGGRLHEMAAHAALGQLALASGDPALAARDLRSARAIAVEMGYWNGVTIRAMLDEAEAAAAAGSLDQAREVLDLVTARLGTEPPAWAIPLITRGEGLLHASRADLAAAEPLLAGSAATLRDSQVPFERGRALLVLGTVYRRGRHHALAREALDDAVSIFDRLGAVLWAARARDELGRIPGRRRTDTDVLTATEERIAALVARGRSNREVAADLFLSVKTIEVTLTRVYEKLGVRSRAELASQYGGPKH